MSAEMAFTTLAPQAVELLRGVKEMPADLHGPHVVFEATLRPNYLASSYFPAKLIEEAGLYFAGARSTRTSKVTRTTVTEDEPTKTLILAGRPERVATFASMVSTPPTDSSRARWDEILRFQDVGLPSRDRVIVRRRPDLGAGEIITWEAVLTHVWDSPNHERAWADEVFNKWVALIRRLGGDVDVAFRRDVEHMTFVPIALAGEALDEAAHFNLLRAIRPMPSIRPLPNGVVRATGTPSLSASKGPMPSVTVATFDGGVNANDPLFFPFVESVDLTSEIAHPKTLQHGTLVTSALLYGPLAYNTTQLPDPAVRVVHHRILPVPKSVITNFDAGVYWMLDRIEEVVATGRYPLISLSVGPNESVDEDNEPSRWTTVMDALAKKKDLTIVSAVGNNGQLDAVLGYNRVQPPGDMVNGISVGACANRGSELDRADYSAVGPGREGQRVQPTGVAFGGSADEPFIGVVGGRLVQACGTSFAAPITARGIGGLHARLSAPRRLPDLSRAYAVHFATKRKKVHTANELGHGRLLEDYDATFECAPTEATVLYEDVLERAKPTGFTIPIPPDLPPDTRLTLRWTISFLTEVDPRDPSDYTRSGLEVTFRPNSLLRQVTRVDGTKDLLHVERDQAEIARILADGGGRSEQAPAGQGWRGFRSESRQRLEGKWETVCTGKKTLRADALDAPRLDLVHLHRVAGQLVSEGIPDLRIVMLVTVSGPKGVSVYDRVAAQFRMLVPLVQLPVRVSTVA